MNVDKQELINKLQNILKRNHEDEEVFDKCFLTDDEEFAIAVAIAVIEKIEEVEESK